MNSRNGKSDYAPAVERRHFDIEPYARRIEKPWGWELHWTPVELPYMGKLLHIDEGKRLSLQAHDAKRETWLLLSGRVLAIWENNEGDMVETELQRAVGYTCAIGQKHRLVAITEAEVLEVSTPEIGTTYRFEDDFSRPDETPQQRAIERGEK